MATNTRMLPVRKTLTVPLSRERAFALFTEELHRWWPASHHIGQEALARVVMQPRAGGRLYEIGVAGTESDWGRVLAWEPPARVLLAWHLNAQWDYDPDPARASEVEVRFAAEGGSSTRVDLEHRKIERHLEGAQRIRDGVDGPDGWAGILAGYRELAAEISVEQGTVE